MQNSKNTDRHLPLGVRLAIGLSSWRMHEFGEAGWPPGENGRIGVGLTEIKSYGPSFRSNAAASQLG